jgi:phage terminase small subunit
MFQINVNVGNCANCKVNNVCEHANDVDDSCRLSNLAIEFFKKELASSPFIEKIDRESIRAVCAIYASVIVNEMFIKKYGVINVTPDGAVYYNEFHKRYIELQKVLLNALHDYGFTPAGRRLLKKNEKDGMEEFTNYIKRKKKKYEPKE